MEAPRIGHREVARLIEEGAQVLDALPADDFARQHIAGAINVPLEEFSFESIRELDSGKPTVTYCFDNQCDLSARLAARLIHEKFSQVYEYAASLADWMAYGLPIEGEEAKTARACDMARRDFPTCRADERIAELNGRLGEGDICAVVDEDGILLGRLTREDMRGNSELTAGECARAGPSTFRPDVPLDDMAKWFDKRKKASAFIITTPDGRPFGILHRADVEKVAAVASGANRRS